MQEALLEAGFLAFGAGPSLNRSETCANQRRGTACNESLEGHFVRRAAALIGQVPQVRPTERVPGASVNAQSSPQLRADRHAERRPSASPSMPGCETGAL